MTKPYTEEQWRAIETCGHDVDRELFSVSAKKYKEAIFAGYDSYEPVVRHELLKSLLQDYKHAIDELLAAIRGRAASSEIRTLRESRPRADSPVGQDALGRLDASEHPPGSEEAATNRSDAGETDDAPTSQSWVLDKLRSLKGRSKST